MGFFGFTDETPKRVTREEWVEIMSSLYSTLDEREKIDLEKFFRGDLFEEGKEAGITTAEFTTGLTWLREHTDRHQFEESDLAAIEQQFTKHLKD